MEALLLKVLSQVSFQPPPVPLQSVATSVAANYFKIHVMMIMFLIVNDLLGNSH